MGAEDREAIWSVSVRWRRIYFWLFSTITLASLGYVTWFAIANSYNPYAVFINIARYMAPAIIVIAGSSLIATNGVEVIMAVVDWIREKTEKHKEAMREEGRRQMIILGRLGFERLDYGGAPAGVQLPEDRMVAKLAERGLLARHADGGWVITEAGWAAYEQDTMSLYRSQQKKGDA